MQVEIKIINRRKFKEMKVQSTERIINMEDDSFQNYNNGAKESNCDSIDNVFMKKN